MYRCTRVRRSYLSYRMRARAFGRRVHTYVRASVRASGCNTGAHPPCDMRKLIVCPGIDALENQNPERPTIDLLLYPHERAVVVSCRARSFIPTRRSGNRRDRRLLVSRLRAPLSLFLSTRVLIFDLVIEARVFFSQSFRIISNFSTFLIFFYVYELYKISINLIVKLSFYTVFFSTLNRQIIFYLELEKKLSTL